MKLVFPYKREALLIIRSSILIPGIIEETLPPSHAKTLLREMLCYKTLNLTITLTEIQSRMRLNRTQRVNFSLRNRALSNLDSRLQHLPVS